MADDERYEGQARDWLESVDVPPPRLEVAQIVQLGRTQVRRRRLLAVGGTVAALAAVAAIPATVRGWPDSTGEYPAGEFAVLDCAVTELAVPAGESQGIGVTAMDPTGRYFVGEGTDTDAIDPLTDEPIFEPAVAILWQDGEPAYIQPPRGAIHAADVNSHGVVVGTGQVNEDPFDLYGWVYSDRQVAELPAPPGYAVFSVAGVNDAGDIAGSVTNFNGDSRAVVWRRVGPGEDPGEPETLPVPDGETAHVTDIAEDGTMVGSLSSDSSNPAGPTTAYLWEPNGVGRELPNPLGTRDGSADAMSGEWVVGIAYVPPEGDVASPTPVVPSLGPDAPYEGGPPARVQLPVRWNLRTGLVELIDPGVKPWRQFDVDPAAVSESGDVLISDLSVPLLLRGDQWFTLPFDGLEARPSVINADGTVIGGTLTLAPPTPSGEPTSAPVVWRC